MVVGAATDAAGNDNSVSNKISMVADLTAPTVTLSTLETDPTNAAFFTVNIAFSEPAFGFELVDISVRYGTATNLTGSGTAYTVQRLTTEDVEITVSLPGNVMTDEAGNGNQAAVPVSLTYDGSGRRLEITSNASDLVYGTSFTAIFTFSESVTGFDESDIDLASMINGLMPISGLTQPLKYDHFPYLVLIMSTFHCLWHIASS